MLETNVTPAAAKAALGATGKQLRILALMLALYVLAAAFYILAPGGMMDAAANPAIAQMPGATNRPAWQLVGANAALIIVVYGLLGLAGYWLTRRAGLPGIYRPGAGWRAWVVRPIYIGAVLGALLTVVDLAARALGQQAFAHPAFPASIGASLSAGLGEEIIFRLFMMGLWSVILTWLFGKLLPGRDTRRVALWIANVIAALAFAASHFPGLMLLAGVSTPAALPAFTVAEVIVLNGLIGVLAGEASMRDGLVAASGIHFWADILWHVIYGALMHI
jgi:membrane protease YdiL (CAAX protease family)